MPRKKKRKFPRGIRQHGTKFRFVTEAGGQTHRSPVVPTIEQAVAYRDAYEKAQAAAPDARLRLSLAEGIELIAEDCRLGDARDVTIAFYRNHSKPLFDGFGGGDRMLDEITSDDVRDYVGARLAAGVSAGTIVSKELFVLRRMLKLARSRGFPLTRDPFLGVRMPKIRSKRFDYLTPDQVHAAIAKMRASGRRGPWMADVVELLFSTGIRRAELVRLRVGDIDFERGHLRVEGKTGPRNQAFARDLEPVLRRLAAAAKPDGRIVGSENGVENAFYRWKQRLNLQAFSPHVLRHSFGTAMAEHVSQWQLMALMGHSDLKQTARYYHGRGDDVRDALGALRPREQSPRRPDRDAPAEQS